MDKLSSCIEKIEAQQKGKEDTPAWVAGEQLKGILRAEPALAEIVAVDLDSKGMGIADCEKKIKAWADSHRKGNFSYVPPERAESIIREFYGLPAKGEPAPMCAPATSGKIIDLADFF